jgi:hypothetical protein
MNSSEIHSGDIICIEVRPEPIHIVIYECVTFEKLPYKFLATYKFSATYKFLATNFTNYPADSFLTHDLIRRKLYNTRILDRKDLILYSYLKYKTSRYFELLEKSF